MVRRLPDGLVFLNLSDPRETLPGFIENLPAVIQQMNAMMFPAVQAARERLAAPQCTNNLKQIGLAMHNYDTANGTFPAPAITDKDGKPLLSWRVAILPYLEQQAALRQVPPRRAVGQPAQQGAHQGDAAGLRLPRAGPTSSRARRPTASSRARGALRGRQANGRTRSPTGRRNTILAVEAKEAVPWTKPDSDLPFDPDAAASLYGAGSPHPGGFDVAMADGSVRSSWPIRSTRTCSGR